MPNPEPTANPELAVQNGTPQGQQLGQEPQPQPAANQAPAAPAHPTVEQLQRERDEARQQAQQFEQRFKDTQAEYTRNRQALAQLAGADPNQRPADPIAPYVQQLVSQGYSEKDARAVAGVAHSMMQPLQQQLEQSYRSLQGQTQVDDVIYRAANTNPADAQLFANPQVADVVRGQLRTFAQQGGQVTPEIALDMAILAAYRTPRQQPGQPGQQQSTPQYLPAQTPAPQPFARGMFNLQSSTGIGQPPAGATPAIIPPEAQAVSDEIRKRYQLDPPPRT